MAFVCHVPFQMQKTSSSMLPANLHIRSPTKLNGSFPSRRRRQFQCASPAPPNPARNGTSAAKFLESLGLTAPETRRAISRLPRLEQEPHLIAIATPTIEYLRNELSLNTRQLARAIRNAPHMLFRSPDVFRPRVDFLDTVARIPAADRAGAIAKCPHVLWMNLKSASRVVQLIVDACPLITPASLGSVLSRVPSALIASPADIQNNIDRIRAAGVCDAGSMARVFAKAPLALVYNADNTIDKRLKYLSAELQLSIQTVGKVLVACPEVLNWSIEKMLRPKVDLLRSVVGADAVPDVIDKVPSLLRVDHLIDRVLWLREEVGLDEAQIRSIVREAPAVLTYSVVGNLKPKWTFISETMGGTVDDVVAAPRETLCANLQQRAMPRYAFLVSMGRTEVAVVDILRGSDVEFCRNVAQCDPGQFREYVDNDTYLLFFSRLM